MIPFNVPPVTGHESEYIQDVIQRHKISGDGYYTSLCNQDLQKLTGSPKVLLTTSVTHALEMAALLLDNKPGDEVILPSFTFV
jgi:dTDP-4-amino-4,6-dideoxygalactose transaminase